MSAESATQEEKKTEAPRSPYALFCELEGVIANVRRAEYDALCNVIADGASSMTMKLYVRHCLNRSPSTYLPGLLEALGAKAKDVAGLAKEIENGVSIFLKSADAVVPAPVAAILQEALNRHMDVAIVTGCPEALAKATLEQWGTPYDRLRVITHGSSGRHSPVLDDWLRLAKVLSLPARQCVAVAGSHLSVKSALCAGMRSIAVPDEFTSFQDFSGADVVLDADSEWDAAELLETVAPVRPFI